MKNMLHKNKRRIKKGVSALLSYVFLIVIVVTLSVLVYAWVKVQIPKEHVECPDGVSIYLIDITCDQVTESGDDGGDIRITIKNKGLFNIDGVYVKVGERKRREAYFSLPYNMGSNDMLNAEDMGKGLLYFTPGLEPGEEFTIFGNYLDISDESGCKRVRRLLIQPIKVVDKEAVLCEKAVVDYQLETIEENWPCTNQENGVCEGD